MVRVNGLREEEKHSHFPKTNCLSSFRPANSLAVVEEERDVTVASSLEDAVEKKGGG